MSKHARKKDKIFRNHDSLIPIINVVNEAAEALHDKTRTIQKSPISEFLSGAVGAGIGSGMSFAALYYGGMTGLSAAGITSGLATAGTLFGGGMVAGVFVLALPIAGFAATGIGIASHIRDKHLLREKEYLYHEALVQSEGIVEALLDGVDVPKDRLEYLQSLNILLKQAIKDLKNDLDIGE